MTRRPFDFEPYLQAQDSVYPDVLAQLRNGRKTGHWMWFVFPQLAGLGHSATSRFYGLKDVQEARAYLAQAVLGTRLLECAKLVAATQSRAVIDVFGATDALKLRSSATLFSIAAPDTQVFREILDIFYAGQPDPLTVAVSQ